MGACFHFFFLSQSASDPHPPNCGKIHKINFQCTAQWCWVCLWFYATNFHSFSFCKTEPPLPINNNFEPMFLKEAGFGKRREKQLWTEMWAQGKARLVVGRSRGSERKRSCLWHLGSGLYVLGSPEGSKQSSDPYPAPPSVFHIALYHNQCFITIRCFLKAFLPFPTTGCICTYIMANAQ